MTESNPPTLTRGVTHPTSSPFNPPQSSVDWLQYSVDWPSDIVQWPSEHHAVRAVLERCLPPHDALIMSDELLSPVGGYNAGRAATFARLFWHSARREQHIGVIFTGADMQTALSVNLPHWRMIAFACERAVNISRIDYALDVFDPSADPQDLAVAWRRGDMVTEARSVSTFNSMTKDRDGKTTISPTTYIGSRHSDRQLRIYDKAKETGKGGHWVRVELQMRGPHAKRAAFAMRDHGIAMAGQSLISNFARCKNLRWWHDALTETPVELVPIGRTLTDTEKWIDRQVIPALRNELARQRDQGYDRLHTALATLLKQRA